MTTIRRQEPQLSDLNAGTGVLRIGIVDDHPIVAFGLQRLIDGAPNMSVVGHATDASSAMQLAREQTPGVLIVDLSLGNSGVNGLSLIKDLREEFPDIRILTLSVHDEVLYAERVLQAGAMGYLMKQVAAREITHAIETVASGNTYLSASLRARYRQRGANANAPEAGGTFSILQRLSDRELEVFELIGRGRGTREIAGQLHVSVKTIETHRSRIKMKLSVDTTPELVRLAVHWVSTLAPEAE